MSNTPPTSTAEMLDRLGMPHPFLSNTQIAAMIDDPETHNPFSPANLSARRTAERRRAKDAANAFELQRLLFQGHDILVISPEGK